MKALVKKIGLFLGMVFLSVSALATTVDPPTIEKIESDINMKIFNGDICVVAIAECCDDFEDYYVKKNNALKVLRSACEKNCKITNAGDYQFIDFIDREQKKVARLVVNDNEKIIMLITHEFKNYK